MFLGRYFSEGMIFISLLISGARINTLKQYENSFFKKLCCYYARKRKNFKY